MNLSSYHKPNRSEFEQTPDVVAPMLLGALILCKSENGEHTGGLVIETEAYMAEGDPAAHHFKRGRTKATAAKFMKAGTIYIHRIHRHFCMDIVSQDLGVPSSILIRSLEPTHGIREMKHRRNTDEIKNLTSGPGKLCQALGIDSRLNGQDILDPACELEILLPNAPVHASAIVQSQRVGVSSGTDLELRFFLKKNPYVSGPKKQD